jgi:hypothetical protein
VRSATLAIPVETSAKNAEPTLSLKKTKYDLMWLKMATYQDLKAALLKPQARLAIHKLVRTKEGSKLCSDIIMSKPIKTSEEETNIFNTFRALYHLTQGGILDLEAKHRQMVSDLQTLEQLIQSARNCDPSIQDGVLKDIHLIFGDGWAGRLCTCSNCIAMREKERREQALEKAKAEGRANNESWHEKLSKEARREILREVNKMSPAEFKKKLKSSSRFRERLKFAGIVDAEKRP